MSKMFIVKDNNTIRSMLIKKFRLRMLQNYVIETISEYYVCFITGFFKIVLRWYFAWDDQSINDMSFTNKMKSI